MTINLNRRHFQKIWIQFRSKKHVVKYRIFCFIAVAALAVNSSCKTCKCPAYSNRTELNPDKTEIKLAQNKAFLLFDAKSHTP